MASPDYQSILETLVSFDTTSRNSNLEMAEYVVEYLKGFDIESDLIPSEDGQKTSVFATIGPENVPGIGLSGHMDVVPVDGQEWATDPFSLVEKNGKLYGRGTCDMKGYLACVMAAVPDFVQRDLKTPVHLVFSYDEETGCTGVRPTIDAFGKTLVKPRMVVVGEPTDMRIVDAHKGIHAFVTEVRGVEAHSSMPDIGVNAVSYASRFIVELDRLGRIVREQTNERFTPPFSSVHVGKMSGGTALNIVPKSCQLVWEVRSLPGFDMDSFLQDVDGFQEELQREMQAVSPEAFIKTTCVNRVPTFHTADNETGQEITSLSLRWAEQNDLFAVSYGTEAGLFEEGGCPTIICGPGNIEQAHAPDEFVEISQMNKCMAFLGKLADHAERGR